MQDVPQRQGARLPELHLQGYFGRSQDIMRAYPYGGLAQFITAPATALVKLPDNVSFEAAARLGYFGTAYSAMKKIGVGPGQTLLINGISGQLGLNAALLALAMGATKILGTGRKQALLDRVKALAPRRIDVLSVPDAPAQGVGPANPDPLVVWARKATEGHGVDGMIDCLPPGAPAGAMMRALFCLRRGGRAVNVGAVLETLQLNAFWMMTNRIGLQGSVWFTTGEGEEMAAMAGAGTLDFSVLEHRSRRCPRSTRCSPAWTTATAASPISSSIRRRFEGRFRCPPARSQKLLIHSPRNNDE